jgi:hypothetical protein
MTVRVAILWLSLVVVAACQCRFTEIRAKIESGSEFCAAVIVPKDWTVPGGGSARISGVFYEAQKHDEVLFSLENPRDPHRGPLPEKYAIDLKNRGRLRVVTAEEWSKGKEIEPPSRSTLKVTLEGTEPQEHPRTSDSRVLKVGSRSFAKSGDLWLGNPFIAPGDQFIALRSFNGWWEGGRATYSGTFFVDIYDINSGKRLAKIRGTWCNWTPDGVLDQLRWVSGHDLMFPYGAEMRDLIVCHF